MAEKETQENLRPEELQQSNIMDNQKDMQLSTMSDKSTTSAIPEKTISNPPEMHATSVSTITNVPDKATSNDPEASNVPDEINLTVPSTTIILNNTISIPTNVPDKMFSTMPDKVTPVPLPINAPQKVTTNVPLPTPNPPTPRFSIPSFTKTPPNDLYRRLLPAVLFVLTFVTVMTMLLIYMDTVALGAQQFRLNMSRDYELARISQESPPLVAYVRQLHLSPRAPHAPPPSPALTDRVDTLDRLYGEMYNGTFVEFIPRGPRCRTTLYLEAARGWTGVAVRAAARDYLALRGATRALHACLSPTAHPREVTYHESDNRETAAFSSRVLCLPLYTVLLAAEATQAEYVLLAGETVLPALGHLPFDKVHLQVIEVHSSDPVARNRTTQFMETKNYTVAATFEDSIMYALKDTQA